MVERYPVATINGKFIPVQRRFVSYDHPVGGYVELHDVEWFWRGNSQTLALADRIEFDAIMAPEHVAMDVHDFAAMLLSEIGLLEELAVVIVGHETDFHALFFIGGLEI